jgi:putative ABC transport system permease protein
MPDHLFRPKKRDTIVAENQAEIEHWIDERAAALVARGLAPDEARRRANEEFGDVDVATRYAVRQDLRAEWRARIVSWCDDLIADLRFAARGLRRSPGFVLVIVASLGVGIGVNTAMFSVLNVFVSPLPVRDAEHVIALWWTRSTNPQRARFTFDQFAYLREHAQSYSSVIASGGLEPVVLSSRDADAVPEKLYAEFVSEAFFAGLGGGTVIGRPIDQRDSVATAVPAVVLSYRFWRSRFGADSSIVGRAVTINGRRVTIAGVAREGFVGEAYDLRSPSMWLPLWSRASLGPPGRAWFAGSKNDWLRLTARLRPTVTLSQANGELQVLGPALKRMAPPADSTLAISAFNASSFSPQSTGALAGIVTLGMVAPFLVLLITCANLVNLLLSRAVSRQREIAIRLAVGASRARLLRQFMAETGLIAMMGGVAAFALVSLARRTVAVSAFAALGSRDPATAVAALPLDARVLTVTAGLSLFVILAIGLAPALRATRTDILTTLKGDGAALFGMRVVRSRARGVLVVGQVTASLALLIVAGMLVRALGSGSRVD